MKIRKKQLRESYRQNVNTPMARGDKRIFFKERIRFWQYFVRGTTLSRKKAINKVYPAYYSKWYEFDRTDEGSKFRVYAVKNKNKEMDQNKNWDKNDQGLTIGKRIQHKWMHGEVRKIKWALILISFLSLMVSIGLFAGIQETINRTFDFWLNPWFYVVPMFCWGVLYFIFLARRQYHYAKFREASLPINLKKKQQELENKIRYYMQLDYENSDTYLSYSVLKQEASFKVVISDAYATKDDYAIKGNSSANFEVDPHTGKKIITPKAALLRCRLFEPQFVQTPNGWRIDDASRPDECGYAITTFDVDNPQDALFVKNNGYVPREIWANQLTSNYRRRLNEPRDKSEPLYNSFDSNRRKNMREAVLLASRCHAVLTAGTGRGKTGYVLLNTVIMLMYSKQKPSLFVNSKGDDGKFLYNWSVVCGYNFLNYNFANTHTADKFNPLMTSYEDAYSVYCLRTEKIEEINISPAKYMSTYYFTYRNLSFGNKTIKDNIEYCINDMRFIKINRHHATGNYLATSRELLEEIIHVTKDVTLEQDLFGDGKVKLDNLSPDNFLKFFLSRYKRNRSIKVNYQIGQIRPNTVHPYIIENSDYQRWLGTDNGAYNNDWYKNDKWYLCGIYAFNNKNTIYENFSALEDTWKTSLITNLSNSITSMLDIQKGEENEFFTKSGKNLFLSVARLYIVGVLKYGPEIFSAEYFTPYNVTLNCDLLENYDYTRDPKYKEINDRLNKKTGNPYGELYSLAMPYLPKCFDGINVATSKVDETWQGITGSRATLTTQLSNPDLFAATCFTSVDLLSFLLRPTIIVTVGVEGNKQQDVIKSKTALILTIFDEVYNCYAQLTASNNFYSPRLIFFLLDEFVMVPWTNDTIHTILIDGRARGVYVFIIAQTRKMITKEPHDEELLDTIKQNCALIFSLGEDDESAAQETSEMCGTYIGRDYSAVARNDIYALERDDYNRKEDIPYITKQEVKNASNGIIFGRLKVSQGQKFFKFRSLLYYTSQIRYMISHDKRISNQEIPTYAFAPISEEMRFDYTIYLLMNYVQDFAEMENQAVFDRDWEVAFPKNVILNTSSDIKILKQNTLLKNNSSYQEINRRNKARQDRNRNIFLSNANNQNNAILNDDGMDYAVDSINFIKHDLIDDIIAQGNIFDIK